MAPTDFAPLLLRRPFEPFRIVTSDGRNYDIRHPEMVMAGFTSAVIGYPNPEVPGTILRYDIVSMLHIVRLGPLPATTGVQGKGNAS
jgi:hypothetical protein